MPEDQIDVAETLQHVFNELHAIADHPTPAVRGPVRLAMGEVAQVLNVLGVSYELYSQDLAR
ncbi:MAG: hypothetical protein M3070_10010 [Actinomycetota bacterium]|nr:hypothetical protein [Actinomycetota bacterium]